VSPLHERLVARGAYFRDVSGWEGADWYAPPDQEPKVDRLSWGRQNWFPYWETEHHAAREGVILMDMSFMSKFLVQGQEAGRMLNWISANDVDGEPGVITYTQWLNEAGRLEADLTVTKLEEERFWVVATDTAHGHVETRLRRHAEGKHAFVTDVTSGYAQVNIQGPRSRELLQSVTSEDLSNEAFPFRTAREIAIGFARVLWPEERSASAMPVSRLWPACGWRRGTATTDTTSTTPTMSSRRGWDSRSTLGSRAASWEGRQWRRRGRKALLAGGWSRSW